MSQHIVFLVHGMGEHKKGWSSAVWALLKERYEQLENDHLWPWDQSFTLCEIVYDDIFEEIRARWRKSSPTVIAALRKAGVPKGTLNELESFSKSDSFLQTHILDVVHYRFIDTVRERVKGSVSRQITARLSKAPSGTPWSVVAHSLGTSVTHDALHALAIPKSHGVPSVKKAHVVAMLANVSRTLQTDIKAYASNVRPGGADQPGVTGHFLNVRHRFDPIPAFWPFAPGPEWPTPAIHGSGRFGHHDLSAITDWNVHAMEHYLGDPDCYVPLFRKLTMPDLIPETEARALREAYVARQLATAALRKVRTRLEALMPSPAAEWDDFLRVLGGLATP